MTNSIEATPFLLRFAEPLPNATEAQGDHEQAPSPAFEIGATKKTAVQAETTDDD